MDELVPDVLAGDRVDRFVAMVNGVSRTEAAAWVAQGLVRVDGQVVDTRSRRLRAGQRVEADVDVGAADDLPRADPGVAVAVVHADADLIVVDKPAGLVVHPGAGNSQGTLVQGLLARFPELAGVGDPRRPGIVHRLDKGTSGLLLVARTGVAYAALVAQLADHQVSRGYHALVWGELENDRGLVDAPIGRSTAHPYPDDGVVVGQAGPDPLRGARDLPRPGGGVALGVPVGDRAHPPDPGPPGRHRPSGGRATLATAAPGPVWCWLDRGCTRPAWSWPTR